VRRFYVEGLTADSSNARLMGDELRHLKVLRLKEGEKVILFNGRGLGVKAVIRSIGEAGAELAIEGADSSRRESPLAIILISALTKGDKPDLIVQKATELGVSSIIFYSAGRSIPEVRAVRLDKRLGRWNRIALGAVKQCGRYTLPFINIESGFAEAMERAASAEVKLFFYEGGGLPVGEVLEGRRAEGPKSMAILIGPEGGFTEPEYGLAISSGYKPCGLGPRILRAETAAIVAVAIAQNLLGDL